MAFSCVASVREPGMLLVTMASGKQTRARQPPLGPDWMAKPAWWACRMR